MRKSLVEIAVPILLCLTGPVCLSARADSKPGNGRQVNAESQLVGRPRRDLFPVVKIEKLDPATKQLAEELEIWPLLSDLYDSRPKSRLSLRF